jgi:hypothetical protein
MMDDRWGAPSLGRYAELGVVRATVENVTIEHKYFRRVETRTAIAFDDWTIDGLPLREFFAGLGNKPPLERTFMTDDRADASFAAESLRALIDEDTRGSDPWVRFSDGRVGLLFCPACGDMDCSTLSAQILVDDQQVVWRDIAYQVGYQPFSLDEMTPMTLTFERDKYEALIRRLLSQWPEEASNTA